MSYNDIFAPGIRGKIHFARFYWLKKTLDKLKIIPNSIIEIGCFDARSISFFPQKPKNYLGIDLEEEALAKAREKWGDDNINFLNCSDPNNLDLRPNTFDFALALETLEHMPDECVEGYLKKIGLSLKEGGLFFVTVPNEIGIFFVLKYLIKGMTIGNIEKYSLKEFIYQTLGRVNKVKRGEHKGFSYRKLKKSLRRYFSVETSYGIPLGLKFLSFNVAFVCRKTSAHTGCPMCHCD
jgi:SAM-dependent methyltransferase